LRALDKNVIDAHRDQVLTVSVVPIQLKGELELGPDAVGAGNQDRLTELLRQLEQGAESADAPHHLRTHGASGKRLDAVDQLIAGFDIDTGIAIRQGTQDSSSHFPECDET